MQTASRAAGPPDATGLEDRPLDDLCANAQLVAQAAVRREYAGLMFSLCNDIR